MTEKSCPLDPNFHIYMGVAAAVNPHKKTPNKLNYPVFSVIE